LVSLFSGSLLISLRFQTDLFSSDARAHGIPLLFVDFPILVIARFSLIAAALRSLPVQFERFNFDVPHTLLLTPLHTVDRPQKQVLPLFSSFLVLLRYVAQHLFNPSLPTSDNLDILIKDPASVHVFAAGIHAGFVVPLALTSFEPVSLCPYMFLRFKFCAFLASVSLPSFSSHFFVWRFLAPLPSSELCPLCRPPTIFIRFSPPAVLEYPLPFGRWVKRGL